MGIYPAPINNMAQWDNSPPKISNSFFPMEFLLIYFPKRPFSFSNLSSGKSNFHLIRINI